MIWVSWMTSSFIIVLVHLTFDCNWICWHLKDFELLAKWLPSWRNKHQNRIKTKCLFPSSSLWLLSKHLKTSFILLLDAISLFSEEDFFDVHVFPSILWWWWLPGVLNSSLFPVTGCNSSLHSKHSSSWFFLPLNWLILTFPVLLHFSLALDVSLLHSLLLIMQDLQCKC